MARVIAIGQHAVGIIAIGQVATGVIAVGQVATGVVAIGQGARGVIAIGMGAIGLVAIGMGAAGVVWAAGGIAVGGRALGPLKVALVPRLRAPTPGWAALAVLQLALLVALAIGFWRFVGVPVGDAVFPPAGVLRALQPRAGAPVTNR